MVGRAAGGTALLPSMARRRARIVRGGHGSTGESQRVSRMPAAHPEGYIEAFANFYRDAAEIIRAHRAGRRSIPARAAQVPDVVDGARGVKFVAAAVESSQAGGAWTPARFLPALSPGHRIESPGGSYRTVGNFPGCT